MKDITKREDIELLMRTFYATVFTDDLIGHYFTRVVHLDLEKHLPVIVDFWETVLLGADRYHNNVMDIHRHLHELSAFSEKHFDRWLKLFSQAVDVSFAGETAERAKQRAISVATLMKIKFVHGGIQKIIS